MSGKAYYLVKTDDTWEANIIHNIHCIRYMYDKTNILISFKCSSTFYFNSFSKYSKTEGEGQKLKEQQRSTGLIN